MIQYQFLFIMSVYCRKGPKTKVLGKIQKNHRNSIARRPTEPEGQVQRRPTASSSRARAARGWRHHMRRPTRSPRCAALPPIYFLCHKNPRSIVVFQKRVPKRRRHRRQDSGDISLCSGTLSGRGIAPGVISINSTAISIAVADSYDEE